MKPVDAHQMTRERVKAVVTGAVQGVGFRPFVYRLATELNLSGSVCNSAQGLAIEAEGNRECIDEFLIRLRTDKPSHAIISEVSCSFDHPVGVKEFVIQESDGAGPRSAFVLPDIATCAECLREIFSPRDRRYLYPFTNCTDCGPRFSIMEGLPYDRANTSMRRFRMCAQCEREYRDPRDRRFHAQPNACPTCGPHLEVWDAHGEVIARRHQALRHAAESLLAGRIVALKGIGGFQLLVDARNQAAVARLRAGKHRAEKPFAVMFPSLDGVRAECCVSTSEERLLCGAQAPIVLLAWQYPRPGSKTRIADSVAPRNPYLGVMLPSSPLHHLLMQQLGIAVVATSGNLVDEPICIDECEALQRLRGIADIFLVHDRPIARHVDDSVSRVVLGREMVLRRARGYAPLPIGVSDFESQDLRSQPNSKRKTVLALGAHLKNSVALSIGQSIFISQHIGDLETAQANAAFRKAAADLPNLYQARPECVVCDLHPDYASTQRAHELGMPMLQVQHHYAHALACMAENGLEAPVLGITWDGAGLGTDGTVWGGEFLLVTDTGFNRVAHLRTFRLPGGDGASREPRRAALAVLYETFGAEIFDRRDLAPLRDFSKRELSLIGSMLRRGVNSPIASSAGRLFDAIASLLGLCQQSSFEGQAAMELEFAAREDVQESYPFTLSTERTGAPGGGAMVVDWEPIVHGVLQDIAWGKMVEIIAGKFHNTAAEMIAAVVRRLGEPKVVLSGGCFQNTLLLARTVQRLREENFQVYWHRQVPPNDGGIAFGQIIAARRLQSILPKERLA